MAFHQAFLEGDQVVGDVALGYSPQVSGEFVDVQPIVLQHGQGEQDGVG